MDKRLYPITILTLVLAALALAGYVMPGEAEGPPVRVLLENKGGKVVFDHYVHADNYGIDCVTCHHETDDAYSGVTPCAACHNEDTASEDMPGTMAAFHLQCMGCHEELGVGPYEKDQCNQCHFK